MNDLETRIAKLEATEEIKQLKLRHIQLTDAGYLVDELTDLWCQDGTWLGVYTDIDDPEHPGERGQRQYHGHKEIKEFWELNRDLYDWVMHLMVCPIIKVNDDLVSATGSWVWLMPSTREVDGRSTATWLGGTQTDEYRKVGDAWKFFSVRVDAKLVTTHERGWVPSRYITESPV